MSNSQLTHNTQHLQEALALLGEAFKNKTNVTGLLTAYINQVQDIEDMLWAVIAAYVLDNAVGQQLDDLGSMVDEPRLSRADDAYRLAIRVQVRVLRSHGRDLDIIDVATLMGYVFTYQEQWPAAFEIDQYGVLADFILWAADKFRQTKLAGTGMAYVYSVDSESDTFIWADAGGSSTGKGWDDSVAGSVGGVLSGVILA